MMQISEVHINETEGYRLGDEVFYEPYTDNLGKLFKSFQKEYGRCTSKIYVEPDNRPIGWCFAKKRIYSDARTKKDRYLHIVWVILHEDKPTKTITYSYLYLDKK